MSEIIVMPRLSDTMEEGIILRWLRAEGDTIARGEELVEIETDKANMTYESDQSGVLHLIAAEGDSLAVGQPIASVEKAPLGGPEVDGGPVNGAVAPEPAADEAAVETPEPGGEPVTAAARALQAKALAPEPTTPEPQPATPEPAAPEPARPEPEAET